MNPGIAEVPSRQEVERQLERMLASKLFRVAQKQARIFRYAIHKALDDTDISEKDISYDVFGGYDPDLDKVRVNITLLRTRIRKYYEGVGRGDLVFITLPPGPAYRPVFTYHEQCECLRLYRRGMAYLTDPLRAHPHSAAKLFRDAIEADPAYAPAYARRFEAELLYLLVSEVFDIEETVSIADEGEEVAVEKAFELNPRLSGAHIIVGVGRALRGEWEYAEAEFNTAIAIDPVGTRGNLWYAAYLLTLGKFDDALAIAKSHVNQHPEDPYGVLVCTLFLYVARRFEEAWEWVFRISIPGEQKAFWLLAGLILLARDRWEHGEFYSGAMIPGDCVGALSWFKKASAISDKYWSELRLQHGFLDSQRAERYGGLMMLCLARLEKELPLRKYPANLPPEVIEPAPTEQKAGLLESLKSQPYVKPLQTALTYLALGNEEKAIAGLRYAEARGDILTRWMHLWPFLDPLRSHARFQRLMEEYAIVPDGWQSP